MGLRKPKITSVFCFQPGFEGKRGVLLLSEELFDARERATSGDSSRFDGFVRAVKIIPGQMLHVGTKDEVGVALPDFELMLLCGAHGAADDLKNVRGGSTVAVLHADGNSNDRRRAKIADGAGRDRGNEAAVGEAARADFDRLKQPGERAACAYGIHKMALGEDDRLAGREIGGHDCKRNAQIFKLARLENALDQAGEAMIAGQTQTGDAPARDIPEAESAAGFNDAGQRSAAGVSRAEDAANAGSRDVRDGNLVLLEDLQDTQMSKAPRKASTESESDP